MPVSTRTRRGGVVAGTLALAAALVAVRPALDHGRAALLLLRFQQVEPPAALAALGAHGLRVEDAVIDARRARIYWPVGVENPPGLVFIHGVHHQGIDEPRQVALVRALAGSGVVVFTPEIHDLTQYRFERRSVEQIADAAAWLTRRVGRARVGVMGISFGGGLALIAASEARQRAAIGNVVSVGAHHDIARVMRFYAGEDARGPDGSHHRLTPHPYGAAIMIANHLDHFFAPADVEAAGRLMTLVLTDRSAVARRRAGELSADGQRRFLAILAQTHERDLKQRLFAIVESHDETLAALSPSGHLAGVKVPVFLLHGADDPIVPSTETRWLAHELGPRVEATVVSPLLRHAELDGKPPLREQWDLVHFMAQVLAEGD